MEHRKIKLTEFDEWSADTFQLYECGYIPDGCVWRFDHLCNPFWRFYHNSEEGNYIETGSRRIDIRPDQVMIIPENTLFNARSERDVPHFWIHFSPPLALRFKEGEFCLPLEEPLATNIRELKRCIDANPKTPIERHRVFHLSLAVLHSCFAGTSLRLENPLPLSLMTILEAIERSLARPPCNDDLARLAGLNRDSFIRWFKLHLQTTPARYITRRRIREACRFLTLSERSIEQIAETLGFSDRHHFTRLFAREFGCGPAEFRRRSARYPPVRY